MFCFFEASLLLIVLVQVDSVAFGDEEVNNTGSTIDPVHHKHFPTLFFDLNSEFPGGKEGIECSFDGHKKDNIFFVVVGEVGDDVSFAEL